MSLWVLILAAGKGTRMKSEKEKVLHEVAGKPMIEYVINTAKKLTDEVTVIVNQTQKKLIEWLENKKVDYVFQEKQLGTGDAVKSALNQKKEFDGNVLILCGDMPLITYETLKDFVEKAKDYEIGLITTIMDDPTGYGRIIRDGQRKIIKIVEEKDANDIEKRINEVNTGVYLVKYEYLKDAIANIDNDNKQNEYYLTDIVKPGAYGFIVNDSEQFIGINDRVALYEASKIVWKRKAIDLMKNGVSILDVESAYIEEDVEIENDVVICPNTFLQGKTVIKKGTVIYPGVRIIDSFIGSNCEIKDNTLIEESVVGEKCIVGPMAHLRPKTELLGENKIGNFVETKKIKFGKGSKASHLTYLGDAEIGDNVNVGCGTITCNYDGFEKHKTVIGDNVFVGSDVQFVAPVKIGDGALIAAGSTITKDVPPDSLGITRAEQKNLEGWVSRWKERKLKSKK